MESKSKGQIAPSLLSCDFGHFAEEIAALEKAGADLLHLDVMDGHFVPNITMGPIMVEAARRSTKLPLDVHLMIEKPEKYVAAFAQAGATGISVHVETCKNMKKVLSLIKKTGVKVGIAINPKTKVKLLEPYLKNIDFILVMSVQPGFGGQKFMESSYQKIRNIRKLIQPKNSSIKISVDGGVGPSNIRQLREAGASIFVAGNSIFKSKNYKETIKHLKGLII